MLIFAGLVAGAVAGGLTARRRGGNRLDIAQYAAVWGILGGLAGTVATIAIARML